MIIVIELGLLAPVEIVCYDKVEIAILVKVKPSCASGPLAFICHACLCGDVAERTVAVVVIEDRTPIPRDEKIGVPVVIEVAYRYALAVVALSAKAGLLGYVGKCSVAVVAIQR